MILRAEEQHTKNMRIINKAIAPKKLRSVANVDGLENNNASFIKG